MDKTAVQTKRKRANDMASKRWRARRVTLKRGNTMVVKDRHPGSKFRTPLEAEPWEVVDEQGTTVTARRGERQIARNASWFKMLVLPPQAGHEELETEQTEEGPKENEEGESTLRDPTNSEQEQEGEDCILRPEVSGSQ